MQEIAHTFKGVVAKSDHREYGKAVVKKNVELSADHHASKLFENIGAEFQVWMSHGDKLSTEPANFINVAHSENSPTCIIAHETRKIYGFQFHPEVCIFLSFFSCLAFFFALATPRFISDALLLAVGLPFEGDPHTVRQDSFGQFCT